LHEDIISSRNFFGFDGTTYKVRYTKICIDIEMDFFTILQKKIIWKFVVVFVDCVDRHLNKRDCFVFGENILYNVFFNFGHFGNYGRYFGQIIKL